MLRRLSVYFIYDILYNRLYIPNGYITFRCARKFLHKAVFKPERQKTVNDSRILFPFEFPRNFGIFAAVQQVVRREILTKQTDVNIAWKFCGNTFQKFKRVVNVRRKHKVADKSSAQKFSVFIKNICLSINLRRSDAAFP